MSESGSQRNRQVFDALVGRRTGIVRDVRFVPTIEGDADLHHAAATMANAHPGIPTGMKPAVGGAGTTREAAVMAALGEALERYLGSSYHCGQELVQSEAELDCEAIPAATLARFSPQQRCQSNFPFQRVTEETPLRWLMGQRLSDDSPCAVPAFAVYLPYLPERGEPPVAPGISTGLSCGDSYESALLGAACEVIERDALALTWLAGISPPRIDQDWFLDQAGDLLPPRDVCQAYDLTSDVDVPVVLVVCQGEGPSGPVLSVGSACRPDRDSAARKAAMEASQDRVYVRHLLQQDPDWRPLPNFSNVTDFSYHARLYSARPDLAPEAFGFLDGTLNPMHSRRERADRRPQRAVVESTFRQLPLPLGEGRGEGLSPGRGGGGGGGRAPLPRAFTPHPTSPLTGRGVRKSRDNAINPGYRRVETRHTSAGGCRTRRRLRRFDSNVGKVAGSARCQVGRTHAATAAWRSSFAIPGPPTARRLSRCDAAGIYSAQSLAMALPPSISLKHRSTMLRGKVHTKSGT